MAELSKRDELRDAIKQELDALIPQLAQPLNWVEVPYAKSSFGASGGMIWTVDAGNQALLQYLRLSPTVMVISFRLLNTSVGGTVSDVLKVRLPEGAVAAKTMFGQAWGQDNGTSTMLICYVMAGDARLQIQRSDLANWTASARQTLVTGCIICEVVAPIGR